MPAMCRVDQARSDCLSILPVSVRHRASERQVLATATDNAHVNWELARPEDYTSSENRIWRILVLRPSKVQSFLRQLVRERGFAESQIDDFLSGEVALVATGVSATRAREITEELRMLTIPFKLECALRPSA